jgi:hypothetical protein
MDANVSKNNYANRIEIRDLKPEIERKKNRIRKLINKYIKMLDN